jgi:hypothetical protein
MNGDMVEMMAKSDMETAIMIKNESKYWQASLTPFMNNPLIARFWVPRYWTPCRISYAGQLPDTSGGRSILRHVY